MVIGLSCDAGRSLLGRSQICSSQNAGDLSDDCGDIHCDGDDLLTVCQLHALDVAGQQCHFCGAQYFSHSLFLHGCDGERLHLRYLQLRFATGLE